MSTFLIVTGCVLLAMAVRLFHIDTQSIWFDEGWSAYAAIQPTLEAAIAADPTNPPLYYVILNLATRLWGDSAFGLRIMSLWFSVLMLPLAYQLGCKVAGRRAGRWSVVLLTCSAPLWWAAQEARMYTLLGVLVLVAALAFHQVIRCPSHWAWGALLLAEMALLYAHNTGPVIVLWLNAAALLAWLTHWPGWGQVARWGAGQIVVGLLWLPWLLSRFLAVQSANSALVRYPVLNADFLMRVWQAFWFMPWEMLPDVPVLRVAGILLGGITLVLIPWRNGAVRWLVVHSVLLVAGLLLGLRIIGNELHGRYLVMIVPLLLVALAAGIARLRSGWARGTVGLMAVCLLTGNVLLAQNPAYQHDDVAGMVRYYAETLKPEDTVLAWSYADRYDLAYYWDRLNVRAQRVTLPEGAELNTVVPLLPAHGRVALNVWYTQRADYRGMLGCVLAHGSTQPPDEFSVYGMSTLIYAQAPLQLPDIQPVTHNLMRDGHPLATVTGVGRIVPGPADAAVCVPVEVQLQAAPLVDLQAAVTVQNAIGQIIAQTSAVLATANQRTTAQLQAGDMVQAYALLRLPVGTPPGDYTVQVRIFDDVVSPSGYDFVLEGGPRKDVPVGMLSVVPGALWADAEISALPYQINERVNDSLVLRAHDLAGGDVSPGETLNATLLWLGTDSLPVLEVHLADGRVLGWPPSVTEHDALTLDWRTLTLPVDAPVGRALIRLPDGAVLAEYTIDALPVLTDAPPYDYPVGIAIGEVGVLAGFSADALVLGQDAEITLIWQAGDAEGINYTVFVQLLDASGQLIGQSDALPANGQRPTTGWRSGEFIVDTHQLRFNSNAAAGPAQVIVGLYDAQTGARVLLWADGPDHITLPADFAVR